MLHAKVVCPRCGATNHRRSRWHSAREKLDHAGAHPYRCRECSQRFIASGGERLRQTLIGAALLIVAVAIVAPLGLAWWWSERDLEEKQSIDARAPADPETRDLAERGDAAAQFRLAKTLLHDAVRDPSSTIPAVKWLREAASQGHTGAMVQLGKMYRSGVGVLQDFGEAANWIGKAAAEGDAEGMLELGRLYRDGVGFERDFVRAYIWFNRAAAGLNIEAAQERDYIARKLSPDDLAAAQSESPLRENASEPVQDKTKG